MFRKLGFRPSPSMAVALAALAVALGGVAFASIPGPSGVFDACLDPGSGTVRVIDSTASCTGSETLINFVGLSALNLLRPYGAFRVSKGHVHIEDASGIQDVNRLSKGKFCVTPRAGFSEVSSVVSPAFDPTAVALASRRPATPTARPVRWR